MAHDLNLQQWLSFSRIFILQEKGLIVPEKIAASVEYETVAVEAGTL